MADHLSDASFSSDKVEIRDRGDIFSNSSDKVGDSNLRPVSSTLPRQMNGLGNDPSLNTRRRRNNTTATSDTANHNTATRVSRSARNRSHRHQVIHASRLPDVRTVAMKVWNGVCLLGSFMTTLLIQVVRWAIISAIGAILTASLYSTLVHPGATPVVSGVVADSVQFMCTSPAISWTDSHLLAICPQNALFTRHTSTPDGMARLLQRLRRATAPDVWDLAIQKTEDIYNYAYFIRQNRNSIMEALLQWKIYPSPGFFALDISPSKVSALDHDRKLINAYEAWLEAVSGHAENLVDYKSRIVLIHTEMKGFYEYLGTDIGSQRDDLEWYTLRTIKRLDGLASQANVLIKAGKKRVLAVEKLKVTIQDLHVRQSTYESIRRSRYNRMSLLGQYWQEPFQPGPAISGPPGIDLDFLEQNLIGSLVASKDLLDFLLDSRVKWQRLFNSIINPANSEQTSVQLHDMRAGLLSSVKDWAISSYIATIRAGREEWEDAD
ncbi:hypothetical protein PVAG01_09860 [Phlyctema vagabunda]|uniref:Uncharacterized protein n=1 Tax=Phlyctema vagabunda TaxID=108571 RepID=A0ABR4P4A2_9HELO